MDGTLIWPKKSVVWRRRKILPERQLGNRSCVLKREFIYYAEAQQEQEFMKSNTEIEVDEQPKARKGLSKEYCNKTVRYADQNFSEAGWEKQLGKTN